LIESTKHLHDDTFVLAKRKIVNFRPNTNRVTRLGELLPIGQFKITEVPNPNFGLLFSLLLEKRKICIDFGRNRLGDFFTNSSGRPVDTNAMHFFTFLSERRSESN
jgi:hypothetical protein